MGKSRLPQVDGARFIQIHDWAVKAVGLAGAAVLGLLDFLDRNQLRPHKPVATRLDISAALQGVVGRDAVDRALRDLTELGWIQRSTHRHKNNPAELYKFALNAEAINDYLHVANGNPKSRTTPSGIQDESQYEDQDNPNGCTEEEGEPPLEMAEIGSGGNADYQEQQTPAESKTNISDSGQQRNIIPEISTFITGLNLDEFTLKRAFADMKKLTCERQTNLLGVLVRKMPGANDAGAYLMSLISRAINGGLTTPKSNSTESNINSIESSLIMTEAEVAQQTKGKKFVLKDEEVIAEVMHGGLYLKGCRFAQSSASKIIRAVNAGVLTMQ